VIELGAAKFVLLLEPIEAATPLGSTVCVGLPVLSNPVMQVTRPPIDQRWVTLPRKVTDEV
jgi:hypothetical protein